MILWYTHWIKYNVYGNVKIITQSSIYKIFIGFLLLHNSSRSGFFQTMCQMWVLPFLSCCRTQAQGRNGSHIVPKSGQQWRSLIVSYQGFVHLPLMSKNILNIFILIACQSSDFPLQQSLRRILWLGVGLISLSIDLFQVGLMKLLYFIAISIFGIVLTIAYFRSQCHCLHFIFFIL